MLFIISSIPVSFLFTTARIPCGLTVSETCLKISSLITSYENPSRLSRPDGFDMNFSDTYIFTSLSTGVSRNILMPSTTKTSCSLRALGLFKSCIKFFTCEFDVELIIIILQDVCLRQTDIHQYLSSLPKLHLSHNQHIHHVSMPQLCCSYPDITDQLHKLP